MQNVGVTNYEYYGMLGYFLQWSMHSGKSDEFENSSHLIYFS